MGVAATTTSTTAVAFGPGAQGAFDGSNPHFTAADLDAVIRRLAEADLEAEEAAFRDWVAKKRGAPRHRLRSKPKAGAPAAAAQILATGPKASNSEDTSNAGPWDVDQGFETATLSPAAPVVPVEEASVITVADTPRAAEPNVREDAHEHLRDLLSPSESEPEHPDRLQAQSRPPTAGRRPLAARAQVVPTPITDVAGHSVPKVPMGGGHGAVSASALAALGPAAVDAVIARRQRSQAEFAAWAASKRAAAAAAQTAQAAAEAAARAEAAVAEERRQARENRAQETTRAWARAKADAARATAAESATREAAAVRESEARMARGQEAFRRWAAVERERRAAEAVGAVLAPTGPVAHVQRWVGIGEAAEEVSAMGSGVKQTAAASAVVESPPLMFQERGFYETAAPLFVRKYPYLVASAGGGSGGGRRGGRGDAAAGDGPPGRDRGREGRRASTTRVTKQLQPQPEEALVPWKAVGKNKRLSKGKKAIKKKVVDPFTRKDWYDIRAPGFFDNRNVGKTLVNRTQGLKNANDYLKGRVLEVSLADLNNNVEDWYRKVKLQIQEVQGKNCLTNFYGMDFTSDKIRSLVKKWQSLIEAHMDVKTTDGYLIRMFVIAFTRRRPNQIRKTTYATHSQIRQIRKKMFEVMNRQASSCDLKELVQKFIPEVIGKEIEKAAQGIYPLQNVFVRKVKILKSPKFDLGKLLELHGEGVSEDKGKAVPGSKGFVEPPVLDTV